MRTAILATGLVLISCSWTFAQQVKTNYMPGTDFFTYHTYAWANGVRGLPEVGGQVDQILDAQIKQAIESQLAIKGFTKAEAGREPDLLLGYQAVLSQEKQINGFSWGDHWGGLGWGPWGAGPTTFSAATSTINVGTFVLGMYDPAVKKLVWIGAAQGMVQPSNNQEKHLQKLNKGAQKLLKNFPPGRAR